MRRVFRRLPPYIHDSQEVFSFRKRTFLAGRSGGNRGAGHQTSGKTEKEKNTLLMVDWRCYSKEGEVPQHFLGHKEYSISSFFC